MVSQVSVSQLDHFAALSDPLQIPRRGYCDFRLCPRATYPNVAARGTGGSVRCAQPLALVAPRLPFKRARQVTASIVFRRA
jgi:hypothetical protein